MVELCSHQPWQWVFKRLVLVKSLWKRVLGFHIQNSLLFTLHADICETVSGLYVWNMQSNKNSTNQGFGFGRDVWMVSFLIHKNAVQKFIMEKKLKIKFWNGWKYTPLNLYILELSCRRKNLVCDMRGLHCFEIYVLESDSGSPVWTQQAKRSFKNACVTFS